VVSTDLKGSVSGDYGFFPQRRKISINSGSAVGGQPTL
jgi:hypothetical protein